MLPFPANGRTALLVIDMQNFFFRLPERRAGLDEVVANINRLSAACDRACLPVFHVVTRYRADGSDWDLKMKAAGVPELIEGTPEAEILPGIRVAAGHEVLAKTRYSAFFGTDLAGRLRAQGVGRVLVAGAYTHYCVNAAVFDAYCHDFVPGLVRDAVLSHLPGESEVIVGRMVRNGYHVVSTAKVLSEIADSVSPGFAE